jgi:hypothetical protein
MGKGRIRNFGLYGGKGGEETLERLSVQLATPRAFALEAN